MESVLQAPPTTKILCAVSLGCSAFGFLWSVIQRASSDDVTLVSKPPVVLAFENLGYFWTFGTAGLTELNPILALVDIIPLFLCLRYMEQIWTRTELLKFVAIVNVGSALLTLITSLFFYAGSFDMTYLYETPIYGLWGLFMAFLVVFKQVVPEHQIRLFQGVLTFRVKRLPLAAFIFATLIHVLFRQFTLFYLTLYGFVSSWIYLRFYRVQDGLKGDRSEAFAFIAFFPEPLQPYMKPVSRALYLLFMNLKIVPKNTQKQAGILGVQNNGRSISSPPSLTQSINHAASSPPSQQPKPDALTNEAADADRRRQIALKQLEARMMKSSAQTTPPTESK